MRKITLEDARADFTANATGSWWSLIPLVGWGMVLALHYLYVRRIERADADRWAATPTPSGPPMSSGVL